MNFFIVLMALFKSEDPREPANVIFYGRCMPFRSFIRKAVCNVLYISIYSGIDHLGISELLEICGSIITGFKVPLKNEHKLFFQNVLICIKYHFYHNFMMNYCIVFCNLYKKDQSLVLIVIGGLLKFWTVISSKKDGQMLDFATQEQLETIIGPLFNHLSQCICSMNFQVAELMLFLWNNNNVANFTTDYRKQILPILYHH